jgi:hypothetical protein
VLAPPWGKGKAAGCVAFAPRHPSAQLGTHQAHTTLREAETNLCNWGTAIVRKQPYYEAHKQELEALFNTKLLKFRDKTIAMFLALDASSI